MLVRGPTRIVLRFMFRRPQPPQSLAVLSGGGSGNSFVRGASPYGLFTRRVRQHCRGRFRGMAVTRVLAVP